MDRGAVRGPYGDERRVGISQTEEAWKHRSEQTCDLSKPKIVWLALVGTKQSIMRILAGVLSLSFIWYE